jgi:AraC-like DNA-binding protein
MPGIHERNVAEFWCDSHIGGLSLLRADFTSQEYKPHIHEEMVVAATELGGAVIENRGVAEEAPPSALFVMNPEEPQAAWLGRSQRWCYRALYLTRAAMAEVAEGLGSERLPYFAQSRVVDEGLARGFLGLHRALEGESEAESESESEREPGGRRELLIEFFGSLMRAQGGEQCRVWRVSNDRVVFNKVVEVMRAGYSRGLRLQELAAPFGLSQFQLISLFKRTVGLTPHAYLTQLRLGTACRGLRGGMSISEAAAAAGFYDQSALTRWFKACYGITPLQFVRASRG